MKIDPYKHQEKYIRWKEKIQKEGIEGVSKENSKLIIDYVLDMENGLNVATSVKKGPRSYPRLNTIKQRITFLVKEFESRFNVMNITKIEERQLFSYFNDLRRGTIRKKNGELYSSVSDYVKVFKAFWHWHMKINRKLGNIITDITLDLDTKKDKKPSWVYLDESQVRELIDNSPPFYQILITFLFDTGIRAPTELMNLKVSDLSSDFKELTIRDEISKTFGRRIKLMLSSALLKTYVKDKGLNTEDYLFKISAPRINRTLKRIAIRVFGNKVSLGGEKYSMLSMYDFRHCSCCYWLPRYKSESALKYRFGWKKSDKIHYYSEMLGMKDTISEEDLLIDKSKGEMAPAKQSTDESAIFQERINLLENQMKRMLELMNKACITVQSSIN